MSVKNRIPERAAMFVNMKTVLSRVEKRGQLETLLKAITDTRDQEEAELGQELLGDPQEVDTYSRVFKENFKVLLGILGTAVAFSYPASRRGLGTGRSRSVRILYRIQRRTCVQQYIDADTVRRIVSV